MAALTCFSCNHCGFHIDSWDEAHPYLRGTDGKRHYYFHPGEHWVWNERFEVEYDRPALNQEELLAFVETHSGCEADYLCMHCGRQTKRDPDHDSLRCTGCGKQKLRDTCKLEGSPCPKCGQGTFHGEMAGIS